MEANIEEALRAKEIAEKRFAEKDFAGAQNYALKAKNLYPSLEGIAQMVATFDVYIASEGKGNGGVDYYSVLGLKPSADKDAVKKQYRKMAVLLHPDKNKTVGADGAFKLVSEAWTLLSDSFNRTSYNFKRNKPMGSVAQNNPSYVQNAGVAGYNKCSNSSASHGLDTFWTVCTSCKVQYEYLRKYVNKRLSCKNCRGTFIAVETGTAPVNGSFPYSPWSYVPSNGHSGHGYDGVTYVPTNGNYFAGNGVSGYHSGHGYEYVSNMSFHLTSYSGSSTGIISPNGSCAFPSDAVYQANGNAHVAGAKAKARANGKRMMRDAIANVNSNVSAGRNEASGSKGSSPDKRRKIIVGTSFRNGCEEKGSQNASEGRLANENAKFGFDSKLPSPNEISARPSPIAPAFDARKMLMDKARTEIQKKLEEIRLASAEVIQSGVVSKRANADLSRRLSKPLKSKPVSITVPDPDFHDFDKDRSEECFKPKQIWALYDEDDGMPRLYCLIREVVSVSPFKIHITYLNSKTDSEFGLVNWVGSGFTKSCGNFRTRNSDVVDQVNVFSHILRGRKAGRGGCIRIYPKSGDIWAVYRNWSPDWNISTPDDVRHQYDMVEVLDDYSEEFGVCVIPLVKLAGYKTVYQSNTNKDAIRWIARQEMLRFSHQVPSCLLDGETNDLPDKCWDLDPAATPDELLHAITTEVKT
ncbi:hypothetical protein HS088_TW22G00220 [Tripterygium wilfordii]|uniref:J domain-containing protein n=1 Tax=Tripterygium wilfordii TaxID=458696 RepID=A0A7J7BXE8_TRIWF|nr:uncharacterized protein LOC119992264 [Tripterygium wilfordii]XP_038694892.1 uncharacterized protein LOC119992264 [Tripterygium wilfordii]KAF5726541.1 hypothetical protein HS088_TW22G00220 [Tripterygium wilfordii]